MNETKAVKTWIESVIRIIGNNLSIRVLLYVGSYTVKMKTNSLTQSSVVCCLFSVSFSEISIFTSWQQEVFCFLNALIRDN